MNITYSDRLSWQDTTNDLARAIADAREQRALVDLTVSNPTKVGIPYPADAVRAALNVDPCSYQPEPQGLFSARTAICQYYADRGTTVCPDDIFLCCSTSEAYAWIFKLLAAPRETVLAPEPSYPLFDDLIHLEGLRARKYRSIYTHNHWSIDRQSLHDNLLPSVRAVLLVNPNNPTGTCVSARERSELTQLGVPLIVDEVFLDYARSASTFAGNHECLTFVLSGLSKVCGLPNLKLGWIVVQGPEDERSIAKRRLAWIADTYLSTASTVQQALPHLLEAGKAVQREIHSRCAANLQRLVDAGLNVLTSDGGWYAIIQLENDRTDEEWALHLLNEHAIIVHPGYFYDIPMEGCIVTSLLAPTADFEKFHGAVDLITRK